MKGICFFEPLFNATIEGRKTQTRRIIKPQPYYQNYPQHKGKRDLIFKDIDGECWLSDENKKEIKPRYKKGEKVYLKEPYKLTRHIANLIGVELLYSECEIYFDILKYKSEKDAVEWVNKRLKEQKKSKSGYCNKLFMPEFCATNFIEITNVKCERLQEISDEDCLKEGIIMYEYSTSISSANGEPFEDYYSVFCFGDDNSYNTPQSAYAALIDKINGKGTWDSNPYVWVYDYRLVNESFDEILEDNKDILKRLKDN